MRVKGEWLRSVVFLGHHAPHPSDGSTIFVPTGTGFVLIEQVMVYLVTAAHILHDPETGDPLDPIEVRLNRKDGYADTFEIPFENWYRHPTDVSADVAVAILNPLALKDYDVKGADPALLLRKDESGEDQLAPVGAEVLMIGLFSYLEGNRRNQPIARVGNVAMYPDEDCHITIRDPANPTRRLKIDAYLIEARSIGGMSGSPVLVWEPEMSGGGRSEGRLMGLVHGHWKIDTHDKDAHVPFEAYPAGGPESDEEDRVNMGISIVVPAYKLRETLDHPDLVKIREGLSEQLARLKEANRQLP